LDNNILARKLDTHDKPVPAHKPDKQLPVYNNCQDQTKSDDKLPLELHHNNHDTPQLGNVDKPVLHLSPQRLIGNLQLSYRQPKLLLRQT
jgi:hypothetical protein